jgi:hypothetical protein
MSWKRRLIELTVAGGLCSTSGCGPFFGCNANPDPCCGISDTQAKTQCEAERRKDMSLPESPLDFSLPND